MLSLNFKYIQNLGFNESLLSSQGLKELFEESTKISLNLKVQEDRQKARS